MYVDKGLRWIVEELVRDKDSRRALCPILAMNHLDRRELDVPCTLGLGFRIREGRLETTASMRSSDMIFGMTNDVPTFFSFAEIVLTKLRVFYPHLILGTLAIQTHSMHVYERHWKMVEKILEDPSETVMYPPPEISDIAEAEFLLSADLDRVRIPSYYQYARWLQGK